jgi:hypothetical protein
MANTMTKIATITAANSTTSSFTFSSIPQIYTDLLVKVSARSSYSGGSLDYIYIQPNNSNAVSRTRAYGNGANAYSDRSTGSALMGVPSAGGTANIFSNNEIYFSNYANTSSYKSFVYETVSETNATTAYVELCAGLYSSNSAITSLVLSFGGTYYLTGSELTLYGINNS